MDVKIKTRVNIFIIVVLCLVFFGGIFMVFPNEAKYAYLRERNAQLQANCSSLEDLRDEGLKIEELKKTLSEREGVLDLREKQLDSRERSIVIREQKGQEIEVLEEKCRLAKDKQAELETACAKLEERQTAEHQKQLNLQAETVDLLKAKDEALTQLQISEATNKATQEKISSLIVAYNKELDTIKNALAIAEQSIKQKSQSIEEMNFEQQLATLKSLVEETKEQSKAVAKVEQTVKTALETSLTMASDFNKTLTAGKNKVETSLTMASDFNKTLTTGKNKVETTLVAIDNLTLEPQITALNTSLQTMSDKVSKQVESSETKLAAIVQAFSDEVSLLTQHTKVSGEKIETLVRTIETALKELQKEVADTAMSASVDNSKEEK